MIKEKLEGMKKTEKGTTVISECRGVLYSIMAIALA